MVETWANGQWTKSEPWPYFIRPARTATGCAKRAAELGERVHRAIGAGMAVIADTRVGGREAYEYFLGPLLRYRDESKGERCMAESHGVLEFPLRRYYYLRPCCGVEQSGSSSGS